jgi:hypothetical protein
MRCFLSFKQEGKTCLIRVVLSNEGKKTVLHYIAPTDDVGTDNTKENVSGSQARLITKL